MFYDVNSWEVDVVWFSFMIYDLFYDVLVVRMVCWIWMLYRAVVERGSYVGMVYGTVYGTIMLCYVYVVVVSMYIEVQLLISPNKK